MQGVLAALVTMEGDGVSVHLVLYLRQHLESSLSGGRAMVCGGKP